MGEAAVAAARAVNYVGAGTVEFIVEQRPDGQHAFLLHGNEHPPAGGAPGDRSHHRPGPGGVAIARGRPASRCRCARTSSRSPATPSKRASAPKTPTTTSCPPPAPCMCTACPHCVTFERSRRRRARGLRRARGRRHQPVLRLHGGQADRAWRHPRSRRWPGWTPRWRRPTSSVWPPMCSFCAMWCTAAPLPRPIWTPR